MIDRYSRPEMAAIWTLENRYRNWFKVEQAVCQAWNEQGVIPDEDLKNIMVDMDDIIDLSSFEKGKEILAKYDVEI